MRISDWSSDVCSSDLAADVHLEAHVERDVIVFGGDEAIETIVENLIDNAIGFSPPGGTVRVVVRAARRGAILSILDQGPGVAPENFEQNGRAWGREREGQYE